VSYPSQDEVLARLAAWAKAHDDVRALILTSSRARDDCTADALSDYDVIVVARDPAAFASAERWVDPYGSPLCRWRDTAELHGRPTFFRGVTYADGVSIDYSVWPEELLAEIAAAGTLPAALDVGYRVVVDKSGVTASWPAPTFRAHVPAPPTQDELEELISDFWWHANKTAKALARGDLVLARSLRETDLLRVLRRLLEWSLQLEHGWSLAPGPYGRGLERLLDAEAYAELAATCAEVELQASWDALFRTIALARRKASEVAGALGLAYPKDVDERMTARLRALHGGGTGQ
jgi:aminoglycoside 6-adenylyltransferase